MIKSDLTVRMEEKLHNRGEPTMHLVWEGSLGTGDGKIRIKHEASGDTREWLFCRGAPFSVLIIDQYTFVRLWKSKR